MVIISVCFFLIRVFIEMDTDTYNGLSAGSIDDCEFIRQKIYNLEIRPSQLALAPCSGSLVLTDPNSGETLACVTYPGYDNNRLANEMDSDYFTKLNMDKSSPFYSRATQEAIAPGSTFKIVTPLQDIWRVSSTSARASTVPENSTYRLLMNSRSTAGTSTVTA